MGSEGEKQDQLMRQGQAELAITPKDEERRPSFHGSPRAFFNWVCKNPLLTLCVLLLIGSLLFCLVIGPGIGQTAGTAIGSWNGVTQGLPKGATAGRAAGLSAKDTEARIGNKMASSGSLEVLLVDLKLTDLYQQGDSYAALFGIRGTGAFSVDLTQAQAKYVEGENQIRILIPDPVFIPYLDDSGIEMLAEYKPRLFDGSTVDGYAGWLNSREQINQKVETELLGYDAMMNRARASALDQVERLARSVCGSDASVIVQFAGEEG